MSDDLAFTAAMVQMRTSLSPEASFKQAESLIRKAAAHGADYVQTPEVSNLVQKNRNALFELLAPEDEDLSLKAYRELARELTIHLHVGSLALRATPERAVNRSFLIAPDGGIVASYDKIHMFDIELDGGESYRESANYQPGETAVISDLPWAVSASPSATTCVFRHFIGRWPKPARLTSRCPPPSRSGPARRTGTLCCAPARSRTAATFLPQRRPESMRADA